jgi:ParB/RepB/Spo0J family partition protein
VLAQSKTDMEMVGEEFIQVAHLHPNPDNPRTDTGDVSELADSIRQQGLLQALLVRPAPDIGDGHYYIEAGLRRWAAMKAWNTTIRCFVRPLRAGENATERNLLVGIVENVHRRQLEPMEMAAALGRLQAECGLSQVQIARQTGLNPSTVSHHLALLELSKDTQERVRKGTLPVGEALRIVRRHRAYKRKKAGKSPVSGAQWAPDHFTKNHPLWRIAAEMCETRGHNGRRRLGGIACGEDWEAAIRQDEQRLQQVRQREETREMLHKLATELGTEPVELRELIAREPASPPA